MSDIKYDEDLHILQRTGQVSTQEVGRHFLFFSRIESDKCCIGGRLAFCVSDFNANFL